MEDNLKVKGGKTIRKLDPGEVLEALEDPQKDDGIGLMRVKCRAEKDGKEGYITLAGNQGTVYLERLQATAAMQRKVDAALTEVASVAKDAVKFLESKNEELKSHRQ